MGDGGLSPLHKGDTCMAGTGIFWQTLKWVQQHLIGGSLGGDGGNVFLLIRVTHSINSSDCCRRNKMYKIVLKIGTLIGVQQPCQVKYGVIWGKWEMGDGGWGGWHLYSRYRYFSMMTNSNNKWQWQNDGVIWDEIGNGGGYPPHRGDTCMVGMGIFWQTLKWVQQHLIGGFLGWDGGMGGSLWWLHPPLCCTFLHVKMIKIRSKCMIAD